MSSFKVTLPLIRRESAYMHYTITGLSSAGRFGNSIEDLLYSAYLQVKHLNGIYVKFLDGQADNKGTLNVRKKGIKRLECGLFRKNEIEYKMDDQGLIKMYYRGKEWEPHSKEEI